MVQKDLEVQVVARLVSGRGDSACARHCRKPCGNAEHVHIQYHKFGIGRRGARARRGRSEQVRILRKAMSQQTVDK